MRSDSFTQSRGVFATFPFVTTCLYFPMLSDPMLSSTTRLFNDDDDNDYQVLELCTTAFLEATLDSPEVSARILI